MGCSVKCLLLLLSVSAGTTSKLNLPRVLLPLFKSSSTNFTLKVTDNGCYRWTLSRLDIIQIIPLDWDKELDCSSEVVLSTITKEFSKNTVIVLVEEVVTREILRCDVIVDVITSLRISTKTKQLFVEESPEIFEVRSYDEQGNEFSTLEGIEFAWTISSGKSGHVPVKNDVIRLINFKDSLYEIPKTVRDLDMKGLTGHVVLLEGVKTGTANISAMLNFPEYKQVPAATVQLNVIANLIIEPADAYLLQGDVIHYKLLQVKNGRFIEVALPSTQYSLEIDDKTIARQFRPWVVETLSLGQTKLVLSDVNSKMSSIDDSTYLPSVTLNVIMPAYMDLTLLPHGNWVTTVHQPNVIVAELFDKTKHKIHIGPHTVVKMNVDSKFYIVDSTKNGSQVKGYAQETGIIHVAAEFNSVHTNDNQVISFDRITAEADISVYPELVISPSEVVIPWDPIESWKLDYELIINGGDGYYQWSTTHSQIAIVTQTGTVKPRSIGQTEITSAMQKNPAIQTSAKITILPPTSLKIIHNTVESEVGLPVYLAVALYYDKTSSRRALFTDCVGFPFKVTVNNPDFLYNGSIRIETPSDACTTLSIVGNQTGEAFVTVSYVSEGKLLKDVARILSYQPLKLISPQNATTVLSVGAQRYVVFTGGPNSDPNDDRNLTIDLKNSLVSVERIYGSSLNQERIYMITCHDIGDSFVTLNVLNEFAFKNEDRIYTTHRIKVICAHPKNIRLSVNVNSDQLQTCPPSFRAKNMVLDDKPVLLKVTVTDERGNEFDNATSLGIKWSLSDPELGEIRFPGILKLQEENHVNYKLPVHHYQEVGLTARAGTLTVTARILNYRKSWLKKLGIDLESIQNKMFKTAAEESITLTLIHNLHLSSEYISVFNHPLNVAKLYITYGSGFYKVTSTAEKAAQINYQDASKSIDIVPVMPGSFVVTVSDECLNSKPISVNVHVLTIREIEVDLMNKIEKGKVAEAYLKLFDSQGNLVTKQELVNLKPVIDSNSIRVQCGNNRNDGRILCSIHGEEIGYANVIFKAGMENSVVSSVPVRVQVYPSLQIVPRNITLIPGAIFQLQVKGGPQPDCKIEFTVESQVVEVDSNGNLFGHQLGEGFVTAKAIGVKKDGEQIVYSMDTVVVNVVFLKGIRLKTTLNKIRTGARIPVWVEGIPEQLNPLILASVMSPLVFKWDLSPSNLAHLSNLFEDAGIKVPDEDKVSMRIHALKSGPIVISVKVIVPRSVVPIDHKGRFTDSISITIVDGTQILGYNYLPMLLAPRITHQLKSNKDKIAQVSFKSWEMGANHHNVLNVDKKGLITTHDRFGFSYIQMDTVEDHQLSSTLPFLAKVSRVRYMMLNILPELQVDAEIPTFGVPKGMKLQFFVSYHDNEGNQFFATNNNLKLQMNKVEEIRASRAENNLILDLMDSGVTVIKVFDEDTAIGPDYLKITTVPYIRPDKIKFTVGDFMCYQAIILPKDGHSCSWNSSHERSLSVNHSNGFAMAKSKMDNVIISFKCSDGLQMVTTADVYALQKVEILKSNLPSVSNNGKRVLVSLALLNEVDDVDVPKKIKNIVEKCGSNYGDIYYPFDCDVTFNRNVGIDVDALFTSYPSYDTEYGHVCVIISKEFTDPALHQDDISVILKVTWNRYMYTEVVLSFKSAVNVQKKKLSITDKEPIDTLRVAGSVTSLNGLKVTPSNEAYVTIVEEASDTNNVKKYSVYLNSEYLKNSCNAEELNVFVLNGETNQNITIPLVVDAHADQYLSPSYVTELLYHYFNVHLVNALIFLLGLVVIFTIGLKIYNSMSNKNSFEQSFFNHSLNRSQSHMSDRSLSSHYSFMKPTSEELKMIYRGTPDDAVRRRRY